MGYETFEPPIPQSVFNLVHVFCAFHCVGCCLQRSLFIPHTYLSLHLWISSLAVDCCSHLRLMVLFQMWSWRKLPGFVANTAFGSNSFLMALRNENKARGLEIIWGYLLLVVCLSLPCFPFLSLFPSSKIAISFSISFFWCARLSLKFPLW